MAATRVRRAHMLVFPTLRVEAPSLTRLCSPLTEGPTGSVSWSMTRVRRAGAAVVVAATALTLLGCAKSTSHNLQLGCVRLPHERHMYGLPKRGVTYAVAGSVVVARVGRLIYAVEGGEYSSAGAIPPTFPYLPPTSSAAGVLTPVQLCGGQRLISFGFPERVFAFRASAAGTATLVAPLAPGWRRVKARGLRPYVATVDVR